MAFLLKELQQLVAGLEEKFGGSGAPSGDDGVKKGAEAQIMKKAHRVTAQNR